MNNLLLQTSISIIAMVDQTVVAQLFMSPGGVIDIVKTQEFPTDLTNEGDLDKMEKAVRAVTYASMTLSEVWSKLVPHDSKGNNQHRTAEMKKLNTA